MKNLQFRTRTKTTLTPLLQWRRKKKRWLGGSFIRPYIAYVTYRANVVWRLLRLNDFVQLLCFKGILDNYCSKNTDKYLNITRTHILFVRSQPEICFLIERASNNVRWAHNINEYIVRTIIRVCVRVQNCYI